MENNLVKQFEAQLRMRGRDWLPWLRRRWGMALCVLAVFSMLLITQTPSHAVAKAAPPAQVMPGMEVGYVFKALLGLAIVLLLIAGSAWLMRRLGRFQGGASQSIRVLGGVAVGARDRMMLVQVGEQQILVGTSPGRLQTLLVLDKPIVTNTSQPAPGGFAQQLTQALTQARRP